MTTAPLQDLQDQQCDVSQQQKDGASGARLCDSFREWLPEWLPGAELFKADPPVHRGGGLLADCRHLDEIARLLKWAKRSAGVDDKLGFTLGNPWQQGQRVAVGLVHINAVRDRLSRGEIRLLHRPVAHDCKANQQHHPSKHQQRDGPATITQWIAPL